MDPARARTLGLAVGGVALAVALFVAVFGAPDAPAPSALSPSKTVPDAETAMAEAPPVSVPMAPRPPAPAVEPAPPASPDIAFIVRFDGRHPMSAAQALHLQGKRAEAEAAARATLAQRADLAGLCFVRFTLGAELVLRPCGPVSRSRAQRVSDQWVRRLKSMRGVQYADANVVLSPESK